MRSYWTRSSHGLPEAPSALRQAALVASRIALRSRRRRHPCPAHDVAKRGEGHPKPEARGLDGSSLASTGKARSRRAADSPDRILRRKARRIRGFAKHLVDGYGGSLERFFDRPMRLWDLREELLSLKGIGCSHVVVLWFKSKEDMWSIRRVLLKEWTERGILPIGGSYYLPYQRGCDEYEAYFGHWSTRAPKYYPERLRKRPDEVKLPNCPLCNGELERRIAKTRFYGCSNYPQCHFTIPEHNFYEVLETGYSEYWFYKGPLRGRVFFVELLDDKIKVSEVQRGRVNRSGVSSTQRALRLLST